MHDIKLVKRKINQHIKDNNIKIQEKFKSPTLKKLLMYNIMSILGLIVLMIINY